MFPSLILSLHFAGQAPTDADTVMEIVNDDLRADRGVVLEAVKIKGKGRAQERPASGLMRANVWLLKPETRNPHSGIQARAYMCFQCWKSES